MSNDTVTDAGTRALCFPTPATGRDVAQALCRRLVTAEAVSVGFVVDSTEAGFSLRTSICP
jgi:hypothetical protein